MAATLAQINDWFEQGVVNGCTHLIVVCDDFDYEDYPVYVTPEQDVREEAKRFDGVNMQRIMEVYSLRKSKVTQLVVNHRTFDYD